MTRRSSLSRAAACSSDRCRSIFPIWDGDSRIANRLYFSLARAARACPNHQNGGICRGNCQGYSRGDGQAMHLYERTVRHRRWLSAVIICALSVIVLYGGHGAAGQTTRSNDQGTPGYVRLPYDANTPHGEMRPVQMPRQGPCDWDPCLQRCSEAITA